MNKTGFLFLGAMISAGSFLFAGCGGDNSGTTGGAGGEGSASSSSSSKSSSGSGSTASSSSGGSTAATCDTYCTTIAANCKDATTKQWPSDASCKASCASFPQGKADSGATKESSLECRAYHAGAAAMDAALHCEHAGPTGGDKNPTDTTGGACGDSAEAFCTLAVKTCPGVYADAAACKAEVVKFAPDTATYSTADTTTNTFGCRFYHLTVAATDAASATMHCPHIAANSATCTK